MTGFENLALWIVVTGIVQLVITAYGVRSITWLQRVSVPLLAILTVVSAILIIKNYGWSSITNYQPVAAIGLLAGLDIVASNAFAWGPMSATTPATPKASPPPAGAPSSVLSPVLRASCSWAASPI